MNERPRAPNDDAPTVLIVEDEQPLADLYARWLSELYAVETAYDGEKALELLTDEIDVVLLDRRMPGLSGDEVLDHVRTEGLDIRVAIVSGVDPDFDVIGMGFDEYLVKPVERQQLHDTVEQLLIRATYTSSAQELAQLIATKAALEKNGTKPRTRDDIVEKKIEALEAGIDTLQEKVDTSLEEFDEDDYKAAFRDLAE